MKTREIAKRWSCVLFCLLSFCLLGTAQTSTPADVSILHEVDTVWNFGYRGVNLASRQMHRIDIAYTSKDLQGNDVLLSGYVCIPQDVYSGEQPCDGILLYQHYRQLAFDCAPTRGFAEGEDLVMANPLKPNWIVVCSDFLGFGINENKGAGQVFCYNDINGQASIDCLLAARKLLDSRNISQGKFLINAGYSSGGFDAIATQRVRDMKYRDQVKFDKTMVGGMPFNIMEVYYEYIRNKDKVAYDPICLPMVLDMFNRHGNLGYTYSDLFKEPLASNFQEWFRSGKVSKRDLLDKMKGMTLSDLIQDKFLSTDTEEFGKVKKLAEKNSMVNGWTPDSTQSYFSMHILRDSLVPPAAGRAFINFLSDFTYDNGKKCEGFKKSVIPERTRLQTNYFLPLKEHSIEGGAIFYLTLAATLTATPILYYDGELNTHYADLIESATLMGIIRALESKGIDVKGAVKSLTSGIGSSSGASSGAMGFLEMLIQLESTLKGLGTSTAEVLLILNDCGIDLNDIQEVFAYLNSEPSSARKVTADARSEEASTAEPFLTGFYQRYLIDWLKENNVNIYDEN